MQRRQRRGWRERSNRYDEFGHQTAAFDAAESDRHGRPGVWHVDHERVVELSDGDEPEWVAVCGCGAAGSPPSLAWQHGMCGPCADRVAEFCDGWMPIGGRGLKTGWDEVRRACDDIGRDPHSVELGVFNAPPRVGQRF